MIDSRFYFSSPAQEMTDDFVKYMIEIATSVDCAAFLVGNRTVEMNDPDVLKRLVMAFQQANIAVLIADDVATMNILLADGVQIGSQVKHFDTCRKALGDRFIIGAYVGTSRHDAMSFGEVNADYVAFGTPRDGSIEQPSNQEIINLSNWWQELFKPPAIAYLNASENIDEFKFIGEYPDFVALLPNFWDIKDHKTWLKQLCNKPLEN